MPEFSILLVGSTPPSFNKVGHTGNRWAWTRQKKIWQEMIETALLAEGIPRGLPRVTVTADLTFPDRRKRDTGNFRTLLEKCAGDALVNGRWLPDDTPEFFEFGAVRFHVGNREGHRVRATKLTLTIPDEVELLPKPPAEPYGVIETGPRWRRRVKG
jgi:hypothetical protein